MKDMHDMNTSLLEVANLSVTLHTAKTSVQPVDDGTSDDLQAEPYMGAVNPDDARDDVWFRGWIVSVSGE
mgnify:CR=1 FL=1